MFLIFYFFSTTIGANIAILPLEKEYINKYYFLYYSLIKNPNSTIKLFEKVDKIVVLMGGIRQNGELEESSFSRIITALLIYQNIKKYYNKETTIIILGGNIKSNSTSSEEAKILLEKLGNIKIIAEKDSQDTFQNIRNLKNLIKFNENLVVITSAFHIKRTKIAFYHTFSQNFVNNNVIFLPCDFKFTHKIDKYDLLPSTKNMEISNIALKEIVGILYYKLYYKIKADN